MYWVATSLVAIMGLTAGVIYFVSPDIAREFTHLGFPDYFRIELGTAKIIGALALIIPTVSHRIKEWTYAGFAIVFASAITAHLVVEGMPEAISPAVSLLFLCVSYIYFTKVKSFKIVS